MNAKIAKKTATHNKYGYFQKNGTEFVITRPDTPRAFDNFIWNEAVFSNVQQTGVGYTDYQVGDKEAIQLFTGIGRICDFDVFGRDGLMSRLVYIRDNDTGEFWNLNWEPALVPYKLYTCTHGMGYTIIANETNGIRAEYRLFIPAGRDPVELWQLCLSCTDNRHRNLSVFSYSQFQFKFKWGFESYGDMIFRGSRFNAQANALVVRKHPHIRPHNFLTAFITADKKVKNWDGTRDAFAGLYNTLKEPYAVKKGACSNTPGSSDATIGALQFDITVKPQKKEVINLILGATDSEKNIPDFKKKYEGHEEEYFAELKQNKHNLQQQNEVTTPDPQLNQLVNVWIKQATMYGATWCRWGWNGYRDIVQHAYGVSSFDQQRTRAILLDALRYQYASGMALRGWNPVDTKAYSDSALWLVFTLCAYLKESGDYELLQEKVPYYDRGETTVQEHIDQALDFLEHNKGAHNLILIKFGDWNDSLTAVGKKGRGESIWLSEAYAEALLQMAELARALKIKEREKNYRQRYELIKQAVSENAWDGKWFVRCYDDAGKAIGTAANSQGKIFTNAQSWALIADIANNNQREKLLSALDKECKTDMGYMLLAPTFFHPDERVGRISCLEPGICENGTVYSHVNAWLVLGLLRSGMPDKAYNVFRSISPGYFSGKSNDSKQRVHPFMYANGYYGPEHRNNKFQMEFTWITGSVAWFYNTITAEMIGVKPGFNGLKIKPCFPSHWNEVTINRTFRGALYKIRITNPHKKGQGKVSISVNG
ncbi:MAG TPA: hypothetical protein VKS21_12230, partial [Spirochaetota bacterium]|nr:hypothetical protein [Spirochaetota bacterium]